MTELKTLKDLKQIPAKENIDVYFVKENEEPKMQRMGSLILKEELRQEIIEWAKYIIEKAEESGSSREDTYLQGQLNFIVKFFNLTEEDLK